MAKDVEESGSAQGTTEGDGGGGQRLNPETGSTGALVLLKETAKKAVIEHLADIIACIVVNIQNKHLPSLKLLLELATLIDSGVDVSQAQFDSFAKVLIEAVAVLEPLDENE